MNSYKWKDALKPSKRQRKAPETVWVDDEDEKDNKVKKLKSLRHSDDSESEDDDTFFTVESSDSSDDDDDDEKLLVAGDIIKKSNILQPDQLNYKHVAPLNYQRSKEGSVNQVEFHPTSRVGMVNLTKGIIDLFQVDGDKNTYLHQVKIDKFYNSYAKFKPDGKSIVACCPTRVGKFYNYDMQQGNITDHSFVIGRKQMTMVGFSFSPDSKYMACRKAESPELQVLSANTYENCFSIRLNDNVVSSLFTTSGDLLTLSNSGKVYVWDTRKTNICKHKFTDRACIHGTAMAYSEVKATLVIGQDVGIVNLYSYTDCLDSATPIPIKTYSNLTSCISRLQFNNTGELLFMSSREVHSAMKLVHSDSGSIFRNFPKVGKNYGHINDVAFSPNSGYLALAASSGAASLIKLNHYPDY